MDRKTWHAAVQGVAKIQTRLSNWTKPALWNSGKVMEAEWSYFLQTRNGDINLYPGVSQGHAPIQSLLLWFIRNVHFIIQVNIFTKKYIFYIYIYIYIIYQLKYIYHIYLVFFHSTWHPNTARQVACLPGNTSRGKRSSMPQPKTRPCLPWITLPPAASSASDALNKSQPLFVRMRGHSQRGEGLCHRLLGL